MPGGVGSQNIFHKYKQPLQGAIMTDRMHKALPVGVYAGMTLTKSGDTATQIAAGSIEVEGTSGNNQARIEFTASHVLTTDNVNAPYVIARWNYEEAEDATIYADTIATALGSILGTDIILGKVVFDAGIVDAFDYTYKTTPIRFWGEDHRDNLKVTAQGTASTYVDVAAGRILTNQGYVSVAAGSSPAFSSATSNPRYDLLVVSKTGTFSIVEGTEAGSPTVPDYESQLVIAEIYRPQAQANVLDENVTQVNPNFWRPIDEHFFRDTVHGLANFIWNEDQDGKTFQVLGNSKPLITTDPANDEIAFGTATAAAGFDYDFNGNMKVGGLMSSNTVRLENQANTDMSYSADPFAESSFASGTTPSGIKCFGGFTAQRTYNPRYMDIAETFPCKDREALRPGSTLGLNIETGLAEAYNGELSRHEFLGVYSDTYGHLLGPLTKDRVPIGLKGSILVNVENEYPVKVGRYLIATPGGFARPVPKEMYRESYDPIGLVVRVFEEEKVTILGKEYQIDYSYFRRVLVWLK